jgi:predicted nucleic acid-binding Zn ribbon protein
MKYEQTYVCKRCGDEFEVSDNMDREAALYCSIRCRTIEEQMNIKRKAKESRVIKVYEFKCCFCDAQFTSLRKDKQFCSTKCRAAFHNAERKRLYELGRLIEDGSK